MGGLLNISAYNNTYHLKVGDQFTVSAIYQYQTVSILWSYDYQVVEPVTYIGTATRTVTFKCIAASPNAGSVIQALTYYYKDGTSSSGMNKALDDWLVYVTDDTTVSLDMNSLTLAPDESEYLTATVSNSSYSGGYTWKSSSSTVASLSGSGKSVRVIAKAPGTTTVTVKLDNGNTDNCVVTVRTVSPTGITVSPASATVAIGETKQLSYSLIPNGASSSVSWVSSDETIASVSYSGLVTGKKQGTTRVTAITANGCSDYCVVSVYKPVPSSISLSQSSVNLLVGDSKALSYTVVPSNAIYTVTWKSDAPDVVEVNSSGIIVAKKEGQATITVTTDNGKFSSCIVTVPPQPTSIVVTPKKKEMLKGSSVQLSYTLKPAGAMARNVTWTTDDNSICSVTSDGLAMAKSPGITTITATTDNGCSATCVVTVTLPAYQFVVWLRSGEKYFYDFEEYPEVSFDTDVFTLTTTKTTVEYAAADVVCFTLSNETRADSPTGIYADNSHSQQTVFHDGNVHVQGLKPGERLSVFDMLGRKVLDGRADASGNISLSLLQVPAGVYIVKSEITTYKIHKK